MAKISQQAAYKAALKIAEPLKTKADELKKQICDLLRASYMKDVPKDIIDFFEKYPKWIKTSDRIYVSGKGISDFDGSYYVSGFPNTSSYPITIDLCDKDATVYVNLYNKHEDANIKYRETLKEIENTILTLGTHKKIGEVMPNALRFLPQAKTGTTTQLVLQIQPIVNKVNCLITNEDKCVDKL